MICVNKLEISKCPICRENIPYGQKEVDAQYEVLLRRYVHNYDSRAMVAYQAELTLKFISSLCQSAWAYDIGQVLQMVIDEHRVIPLDELIRRTIDRCREPKPDEITIRLLLDLSEVPSIEIPESEGRMIRYIYIDEAELCMRFRKYFSDNPKIMIRLLASYSEVIRDIAEFGGYPSSERAVFQPVDADHYPVLIKWWLKWRDP